jgi:ferredoxin
MKIRADRDICIGAGNCVLAAENVFDQDDDAIVVVLQEAPDGADADAARHAVGSCPSGALAIEEA